MEIAFGNLLVVMAVAVAVAAPLVAALVPALRLPSVALEIGGASCWAPTCSAGSSGTRR